MGLVSDVIAMDTELSKEAAEQVSREHGDGNGHVDSL